MVDQITGAIMEAIEATKKETPSRETSLVITKLEEALLWWGQEQHLRSLEVS